MSHIVLVDASNLCRRAWSVALREKDSDGAEIGTLRLAPLMVMKLLTRMSQASVPVQHFAMLFDGERDTGWRRRLYSGYKSSRPPYEQDYLDQLEDIRDWCDDCGIFQASSETHEADDLIAALALEAHGQGKRVSVISNDKDLMQLIRPGIMQFSPQNDRWYNAERVRDKFGVSPELLGDLFALAGDSGDDVPGAPGIGMKTAASILNEYGDLEAALADPSRVSRPSARAALTNHADRIRMSRELVRLDASGADLPFRVAQVTFPDRMRSGKIYEEMLTARCSRELEPSM